MKPYVYQRKSDGKFVGVIELDRSPGEKRNRKPVYGNTEDEVWEKLNEIAFEIQTGQYVPPTKDTLVGFLKEYHGICAGHNAWDPKSIRPEKPKWEETTAALFKMYIDIHFEPYFKDDKLINIKPMVLDKFYNHKLTEPREHTIIVKGKPKKKTVDPLSINTVIKLNKFLKAAFNYAVLNGIIKKNPTIGVKLGTKEDYKPAVYNEEQFLKLLDDVTGTDDEIPIVLAAGCGFRRGEAFGVYWRNVDLENHLITVEKTSVRFNKNLEKKPKSKNSSRTIYAPGYVIETLVRSMRGKKINPDEKIITRWKAQYYSERFKDLLEQRGLDPIRYHDLRHFNSTIMMNRGVPDTISAARIGDNVSTLKSVYQHSSNEEDRKAADAVNEVFINRESANGEKQAVNDNTSNVVSIDKYRKKK